MKGNKIVFFFYKLWLNFRMNIFTYSNERLIFFFFLLIIGKVKADEIYPAIFPFFWMGYKELLNKISDGIEKQICRGLYRCLYYMWYNKKIYICIGVLWNSTILIEFISSNFLSQSKILFIVKGEFHVAGNEFQFQFNLIFSCFLFLFYLYSILQSLKFIYPLLPFVCLLYY